MGKIWVEVSLVSAHGLGRSPSFWKRQWFAVGWIHPNCKYCTKVDDSGSENPVWKTKFAVLVDDSESEINIQDLVLNVEVHSIDPIFLSENIYGSASVIIKEFLAKEVPNSGASVRPGNEEVWSYQLRKKDSDKPRGFIDISIRVFEEKEYQNSNPGVKWRGFPVIHAAANFWKGERQLDCRKWIRGRVLAAFASGFTPTPEE